jgi:hypothetical protein
MPALYYLGFAPTGHPQGDALTDCYYLSIIQYHELQKHCHFRRDRYGSSVIAPAPVQAATAQDFVNLFDFLKRYVTDLDKMTNPAPAIPAVTQPDIPETEPAEPETTEEAESN